MLELCNGGGDLGFACSLSLRDVYYVLERYYDEHTTRRGVEALAGLVAIAPVGTDECYLSLQGNEPDFEDGLVRACAELNDIDFILTRDDKAFGRSKVRKVTCAQYLAIVGEEGEEAWPGGMTGPVGGDGRPSFRGEAPTSMPAEWTPFHNRSRRLHLPAG